MRWAAGEKLKLPLHKDNALVNTSKRTPPSLTHIRYLNEFNGETIPLEMIDNGMVLFLNCTYQRNNKHNQQPQRQSKLFGRLWIIVSCI